MTFITTVLAVGFTILAAGEFAKEPTKGVHGADELRCEKIKVVEVRDNQKGEVEVRTPAEIPLDTKLVTIGKNAILVQPVIDKGKPALDLQTFRIVSARTEAVYAVQERATSITALALDRATSRMVLSRAMAGDKVAPGTVGFIAYYHCSRFGK